MSENGNAVRKKAREWLRHADDDLRLARLAFKLKSAVPYKLIAYHAQQCAEKCLKAYLVFKKIDFPYTHDLSLLLDKFPPSASWSNDIRVMTTLSIYAITTRYPGEDKVTKKEALQAVSKAETIQDAILRELARDGFKILSRKKI
jgi:HEPN domain-containing protein